MLRYRDVVELCLGCYIIHIDVVSAADRGEIAVIFEEELSVFIDGVVVIVSGVHGEAVLRRAERGHAGGVELSAPVRIEDAMSSAASAAVVCELFILTLFLSMVVCFVHETFGHGVVIQLSEQDFIG